MISPIYLKKHCQNYYYFLAKWSHIVSSSSKFYHALENSFFSSYFLKTYFGWWLAYILGICTFYLGRYVGVGTSKYHMNGSKCLHFSPFQKCRTNKIKAILKMWITLCDISIDFTVIVLILKWKCFYLHIINCFNN